MKLKLKVEEKEIIMPEFKIYKDFLHNDLIVIAIKNLTDFEEKEIITEINNKNIKINISNFLDLEINNKIYRFDISDYDISNLYIEILFDFLNNNNIMKNLNNKIIIYEN